MNFEDTGIYLSGKEALFTYLVVFPIALLISYFSFTYLVFFSCIVALLSVGLSIFGR